MKIFLAEDDRTSRSILTAILKKWGYDPVVSADGAAAWDILKRNDAPKLVLLDWNMPEMDGLEVCRLIRKGESHNPAYVIILTGKGEKSDIVQGLDAGANDYICKPYDNNELMARIRVGRRMVELQTALVEARDTMEHQALHDALTGIFNRRAVLESLGREISRVRREGGTVRVGMLDIDFFKKINDTYGHQVGDEVLIGFVRTVQRSLREYDVTGRYGGEEFLVIVPAPKEGPVESVFERVRSQVADTALETSAGPISITVSIGTVAGSGASTIDEMLRMADLALYRAKAEGRNRVCHSDG
jgi:two-component system, cell cycle response regulator